MEDTLNVMRNDRESADRWDRRWMDLANLVATWSKDRSRKVGAVIVNSDNAVVSLGWNGFPRGVNDDLEERHGRPAKYDWTEHAERNAIFNAAAIGVSTKGSTMYLPWYPCSHCARAIIQSGIRQLVTVQPDWLDPKYGTDMLTAGLMFHEAGVDVRSVHGEPPAQKELA